METFTVESFTTKGMFYTVRHEDDKWTCECPHFLRRLAKRKGLVCKHIRYVRGEEPFSDRITILRGVSRDKLFIPELEEILKNHPPATIFFDVDGTLEVSHGVVKLDVLRRYKSKGWTVGIISGSYRKVGSLLEELDAHYWSKLGQKTEIMKRIEGREPKYYCGNSKHDLANALEAGWKYIDARRVKALPLSS